MKMYKNRLIYLRIPAVNPIFLVIAKTLISSMKLNSAHYQANRYNKA